MDLNFRCSGNIQNKKTTDLKNWSRGPIFDLQPRTKDSLN